jgi:hypothetical protein
MTVRELIERLQSFPPDMIVLANLSKNELANGREVRTVELSPVYSMKGLDNWHENFYPDLKIDDSDDYEYRAVVNVSA